MASAALRCCPKAWQMLLRSFILLQLKLENCFCKYSPGEVVQCCVSPVLAEARQDT